MNNFHSFLFTINFNSINMNSTFAVISILIKGNIGEKCLVNFLMNVSAEGLKDYLECASINKGTSPKKKTYLIEMIVYGCMTAALKRFRRHQ